MHKPESSDNIQNKSLAFIGDPEITLEINDFDREVKAKESLEKRFRYQEDLEENVFYEIENAEKKVFADLLEPINLDLT